MSKNRMGVVAILALLITCAYCASIYHDCTRSEAIIDYPHSVSAIGHNGSTYFVDPTLHPINSLHSYYDIILSEGSEKYIEVYIDFSEFASGTEKFVLDYTFWTKDNSLVPAESVETSHGDTVTVYTYTDGLTGDVLIFEMEHGLIKELRIHGKTATYGDGALTCIDFDLYITYSMEVYYVQDYTFGKTPAPVTFDIIGSENGTPMNGTVHITPLQKKLTTGDYGIDGEYVPIHVTIDIPGSSIPAMFTDFYIKSFGDLHYFNDCDMSVLSTDNVLISSDITDRVDEHGFTLRGTISIYELDDGRNVTATTTIIFDYGAAA